MITSATIGNIIFNSGSNYFIDGFKGLEMPPTRVVNYNLAGEHFGLFVNAFYGKRRFVLKGWVIGSSVTDFISRRDAFQSALDIKGGEITVKFTLANNRQVQIDAVLMGLDFTPIVGGATGAAFQVEFEAAFPFLVSQSENSQNLILPAGGGGKVPPDTMPMALGGNSGGSITAINNGNGIYYPTVRFLGPVSSPQITNFTTGKSIRLGISISSGSYIDVDFKRKTVTDNLGTNKYSVKSGEWWYLQPGNNEIRFTADSYDPAALCNFKYKDSWLGI